MDGIYVTVGARFGAQAAPVPLETLVQALAPTEASNLPHVADVSLLPLQLA